MAYSKIILNGETLMDVTEDTVDSGNLLSGEIATKNSGAKVTGSLSPVMDVEVDGTSVVTSGVAEIDLTGKADAAHTHTKSQITDFPTLASVATSGDYDDLTGKPTIPDVSGKIDTAGTGLSKSSTTLNHSNSVTAQTTQALYPVKIDAQGHISAYGSAVTVPTVTDTYSGTSSNAMSGKAVKSAIDTLDGTVTGTAGSGKTLTAFSQTDGKVSATFGDISITKSQVSDFPTIPDVSGKIDTAGTGLSKSSTTLNHSNSITAQNTQAVYPIKIDAQGHISAYGSAVTVPTLPSNIVNTITTTTGTHTAITSQKGDVSFNVPTKTSHLTNDSGFITSYTDENMKWTASTSSNTYYPLQSTSTATTSTANTLNGVNFYQYYNTAGGYRRLTLGNSTAWKSAGGAYGTIRLYGAAATYYGDLVPGVLGTTSGDGHISANRTWTLPDASGTIALADKTIPSDFSKGFPICTAYNGSSTTGVSLTNNVFTQMLLNSSTTNNETYIITNGTGTDYGITINANGYYKVSASLYFTSAATAVTSVGAYIYKASNGGAYSSATEFIGAVVAKGSTTSGINPVISPKLVSLSANDRLYLSARSIGGTSTAYPGNAASYLTVELVELY